MDRDDSCFANPHTHWDELCSCSSSRTQSSENINKQLLSHSQVYTPEGDPQDYPPSALRVIPPHSKSGMGREPGVDSGIYFNLQAHHGN